MAERATQYTRVPSPSCVVTFGTRWRRVAGSGASKAMLRRGTGRNGGARVSWNPRVCGGGESNNGDVETVTRIDGGSRGGDAPASVSFRVDDGLASRLGVVVGGGLDERGETLAGVRCGVGLGGIVGAQKKPRGIVHCPSRFDYSFAPRGDQRFTGGVVSRGERADVSASGMKHEFPRGEECRRPRNATPAERERPGVR